MKEEQKQPAITYPFASGAGAATVSQTSVAAVSTTSAPQMNTFQFAAATSAAPPSCDNRPPGGEDVANALRALKQELSNLPHELKSELVHVQRVNSGLVNDSHLLGFLHAEEFRVDVSLSININRGEVMCVGEMCLGGVLLDQIDTYPTSLFS